MNLNGFTLTKFKKTLGMEGGGYIAALTLNKKPVATYEDHGDGALETIRLQESGWGQKELWDTVLELHKRVPIPYLEPDSIESCASTLFGILTELREMESFVKRSIKRLRPQKYIILLMTGQAWKMIPMPDGPCELADLHIYGSNLSELQSVKRQCVLAVKAAKEKRQFRHLCGLYIFPSGLTAPFDLSIEQYASIFDAAKEVEAQL